MDSPCDSAFSYLLYIINYIRLDRLLHTGALRNVPSKPLLLTADPEMAGSSNVTSENGETEFIVPDIPSMLKHWFVSLCNTLPFY